MAVAGAAAAKKGGAARTGTAAKKAPAKKAPAKGSSGAGRADQVGAATKSDVANLKAQAAEGDDLARGAYEAGLDGTPWEDLAPEVQEASGGREAYETGLEERARERRSAVAGKARGAASSLGNTASSTAGLRGPGWVNDGAGFVLGLIGYALALNYLQGGPAQVRGWLRAKFLNQPYGGKVGGTAGGVIGSKLAEKAKAAAKADGG